MPGPLSVKDWPNLGLLSIQIDWIRRGSPGSAALVDTVDDVLEPGPDIGAVTPFVDDPERVLQEQERAVRGPVFLRTARIWSGEHMVTPEQDNAAGRFRQLRSPRH